MTIINANSFTPSSNQPDDSFWVEGTVEVTLRNETRTVKAIKRDDEITATIHGITDRYQTATKAWPFKVTQHTNTKTNKVFETIRFGRNNICVNSEKTNSLQFA